MRKAVPKLDDSLTKNQFLNLIVKSFQSVVFGTVNKTGYPLTNVVDIGVKDDNQLIFATTYQKVFYDHLP